MAVYQAALGSQPSLDIDAGRSKQGSIDALIVSYLKSGLFTA